MIEGMNDEETGMLLNIDTLFQVKVLSRVLVTPLSLPNFFVTPFSSSPFFLSILHYDCNDDTHFVQSFIQGEGIEKEFKYPKSRGALLFSLFLEVRCVFLATHTFLSQPLIRLLYLNIFPFLGVAVQLFQTFSPSPNSV